MNSALKTRRSPWPAAIIGYFIFFITFTVVVVVCLSRQKMDLVRGDYYDDEIRYQEQLDRMNRTVPFDAQVSVTWDHAGDCITVALPSDHAHSAISGRIRLYRPSDETQDQDVRLSLNADGRQQVDTKQLAPGLWKVRVYWTADGKDYFHGESVIINRRQS